MLRPRLGQKLVPGEHTLLGGDSVGIRHDDRVPQCRELFPDLSELSPPIDAPIPVVVPNDCEQDRGLDLTEPVGDGPDTELRWGRGPHRAETGRGQKRDHGLGDVGQIGGNPIAAAHAQANEASPARCHPFTKLGHRQFDLFTCLGAGDDGRPFDLVA